MFVYFIFAGYRVAIGKAKNILARISIYQRTYLKVEVLGLIKCESAEQLKETERQMLKRFKSDNAFRDMFYLSPDMLDFIVENTITISPEVIQKQRERQRKRYHNDPDFRERRQKSDRIYRQTPEYKKRNRERHHNDPEYRKRQREYQRKYKAQRRKTRPASSDTLALPGIE